MLKRILSIAGRPGLFKLVNQGKNMLIVESLLNGKRTPAYARDKVVSLGDISIYTTDGDVPLADVLESIREKNDSKQVDIKAPGIDIRKYFAEVLPAFDEERVYTNDIKKVFSWYNQLIASGITEFKSEDTAETEDSAKGTDSTQQS